MLAVFLYCKERFFFERKDPALVFMQAHSVVIVNGFQTLSGNLGKKRKNHHVHLNRFLCTVDLRSITFE